LPQSHTGQTTPVLEGDTGLRFRSLAVAIVPEAAQLDEAGWRDAEAVIERALAQRPARLRRQLRLFIRLLDVLPIALYGRGFRELDPERQNAFLHRVQRAPLLLLRRGFWGLRTLVFMGFYARESAGAGIGYRAHPRGWEMRR
jgi:hypothetical protein